MAAADLAKGFRLNGQHQNYPRTGDLITRYKLRFERMVQGFYFPRQRITHIYIPAQTYPSNAKE